ncbi:hypothetical protein LCL95_00375 [Bacillus timonensis]|nr:hypothetical protein [Bacillus timonensis]
MNQSTLYFSDNFFSSGMTEIFNEQKEIVGYLDLKSAFSSSVDILDKEQSKMLSGSFPFFSNKWYITDTNENELGYVKTKFSFFTKRFAYYTQDGEEYLIESEAFSREYRIFDLHQNEVAHFEKVSSFFSSPAYQLKNHSDTLTTTELILVVMGVNAINKRRSANGGAAGGGGAV